MKKGIIFLAKGFEEIEAVTPLDLLRRASLDIRSAGIGGRQITGSHGITITADCAVDSSLNASLFDFVIIPGGMPGASNIASSQSACDIIRVAHAKGSLICAICAAPSVVLYPLGILEGRRATCYPGFEKNWNNCSYSDERVVHDGNVITSRGAGTAAEFAFEIIRTLAGNTAADEIEMRIMSAAGKS